MKNKELETKIKELEDKYNIQIKYVNNNKKIKKAKIICPLALSVCLIVTSCFAKIIYNVTKNMNTLKNTEISYLDDSYKIKDIYVIFSKDFNDIYFCTKEYDSVVNNFLNEPEIKYYYKNIKTKEKVCDSEDNNYYIANLYSIYEYQDAKNHDFNVTLNSIENEKTKEEIIKKMLELNKCRFNHLDR